MTHLHVWRNAHEWVTSNIHINESRATRNSYHWTESLGIEALASHLGPLSLVHRLTLTGMWYMTHAYMWLTQFIRVSHSEAIKPLIWHSSSLPYLNRQFSTRVTPPFCAWHDKFIHVTWLFYTCDMTHYVWHDTCTFQWHWQKTCYVAHQGWTGNWPPCGFNAFTKHAEVVNYVTITNESHHARLSHGKFCRSAKNELAKPLWVCIL